MNRIKIRQQKRAARDKGKMRLTLPCALNSSRCTRWWNFLRAARVDDETRRLGSRQLAAYISGSLCFTVIVVI